MQKIFVYLMLSPQIIHGEENQWPLTLLLSPQIIHGEENQWPLTLLVVYQCKILIVV